MWKETPGHTALGAKVTGENKNTWLTLCLAVKSRCRYNSSYWMLKRIMHQGAQEVIKIIMKILRTISQKKFERVELRLLQYNIQLTGALMHTTLGKT